MRVTFTSSDNPRRFHTTTKPSHYIDALQLTIGDIVSRLWLGVILVAANPQATRTENRQHNGRCESSLRRALVSSPCRLGIGTGTVQRISKERAMSPRGAQQ